MIDLAKLESDAKEHAARDPESYGREGASMLLAPAIVLELLALLRTAESLVDQSADARRDYIRQHAPTILAGLAANANGRGSWNELRAEAKEQAGLLFDETRVK